jgi:hypothetical protein
VSDTEVVVELAEHVDQRFLHTVSRASARCDATRRLLLEPLGVAFRAFVARESRLFGDAPDLAFAFRSDSPIAELHRAVVEMFRSVVQASIDHLHDRDASLSRIAVAIVRLMNTRSALREFVITQSAWFPLHGSHPPRTLNPKVGSSSFSGWCDVAAAA